MKILTDSQTPMPFVRLLRALGWDVRTVYDEGTEGEKEDYRHLINARGQDRVLLTYDYLKGESGAKVAAELLLRGGRIIQIRQGPEQPLLRAVGRLLFHHPDWYPFLQRNHGVALISDIRYNCRLFTPEQYSQTISSVARPHFEEYLRYWEEKGIRPPRRRVPTPPPSSQRRLDI